MYEEVAELDGAPGEAGGIVSSRSYRFPVLCPGR